MAIAAPDFQTFIDKFESVKENSDLFAFLLFDDRSSHDVLRNFAYEMFEWLDSLAAASKMYVFVPISLDEQEVINPSLQVADTFGISANQLPGFVLFTLARDRKGVGEGAYFPLDPKVFEQDVDRAELLIADLFSVVQECQRNNHSAEQLLSAVTNELNTLQRREKLRPLKAWLTSMGKKIGDLPFNLLDSMATAYGAGLAK